MPGVLLLLRAYKLKRAVKRLKRAKENALREHKGQRPRYPWYEECFTWFIHCLRDNFCNAFCSCCLHPKQRKIGDPLNYTENFWRRPCSRGTFENFCLKSVLGFFSGLLLTTGIFFFLLHQLNCNPKATTTICCLIGIVLTNGLSFSSEFRCITMLAMPGLFSNRGRMVLLAYVYILVMSGPAKNVLRNANILVHSLNCGQEMITKQAKAILKAVFAPLVAIIDAMRDILQALKEFARMLKEAFLAIRDLFLEIINAIKVIFQWLLSIVEVCASKYGSPYEKCNQAFDGAIEDCRIKMGVFKFLCEIVSAVKYICEIARIVDLLCMISKAVKTGIIEPLKEHFKAFARYMYVQFYVNVTFVHYYNYTLEQSKSFQEIRGDIQEEIRLRTEWLISLIDWSDLGMAFVLLILVFKAYVYRIRYLTADHFDNVYINFHVRDIDDRRAESGKETILPLSVREKKKYVPTFSVRMVANERRNLFVAGTMLLLSGLQMGFNMMMDYAMYRFLKMMRYYGAIVVKGQLPAVVQIKVKGNGVMADMYRNLVTQFDPLLKSTPEFDISTCLPDPVPIDVDKYQLIGILYLTCLLMAITESYGLRLRHLICAAYYPARERMRAVWLYNHILKTRGGLRTFLRRRIRRKVYGDDTLGEVSFLDRLLARYTWLENTARMMGYVRVYCVGCSDKLDTENDEAIKRCSTPGCKGIYCKSCFEDLGNLCTLCMKPVEYGDLSDFSEEKDSSEEEETRGKFDEDEGSSDGNDYDYQYQGRERLDDDDEESSNSLPDIRTSKSKRELATVNDFSEDEEEFDV